MSTETAASAVRIEVREGGVKYVTLRPDKPRFRALLSIDGGGVRGIVPAKVLQGFEKAAKEVVKEIIPELRDEPEDKLVVNIKDNFDMVAGNSAGSILALYIASAGGRPELYQEKGLLCGERPGSATAALRLVDSLVRMIFRRRWWSIGRLPILGYLTGVLFSKYGNHGLKCGLDKIFGEMTMKDLKMNAYVPAYELDNSRPVGFYSRIHHRNGCANFGVEAGYSFPAGEREEEEEDENAEDESESDDEIEYVGILPKHFDTLRMNLPVKVVSQASASAPVYFANTVYRHKVVQKTMKLPQVHWVDGGVVSNNPTLQALAFMATCFACPVSKNFLKMEEMAVLSIGTGSTKARASVGRGRQGLAWWGLSLVSILMDSHSEINHKIIDAMFDGALFGPPHDAYDRYVRINKVARQGDDDYKVLSALDTVGQVKRLKEIGEELAEDNMEMMKNFIRNILMAEAVE